MALPSRAAKALQVSIATLAMLFLTGSIACAQWLSLPLPGTPRTADGKPNLTAPAPRTPDGKPDLSGIWHAADNSLDNLAGKDADVPMLPAAAALYKHRQETLGQDKPQLHCMPHGVPDAMLVPIIPFKIVQTPRETIVLYEEFNQYRQIFTDGRKLPEDFSSPAWFGYSVGKWEGDTFVVEVDGFKEGTWLDNGGHPHTEQLHITERYRRPNFGNLELEVAINDPGAYPKPWKSAMIHFKLLADTELLEHLCENERDAAHAVFK
jgi:hypothetical protein